MSLEYREKLYRDYSNNFGDAKPYSVNLEFPVFEATYPMLKGIDLGASIADLGCGRGEWLLWLKGLGFSQLSGFDFSTSELEKASGSDGSLKVEEGDVSHNLLGKEKSYDLLHAKDVFEHFTKNEAVAFMEASRGALKVGGELWILTYNGQAPLAASTGAGDFTHELAVTPTSIAQLARATGFEVISIKGLIPVGRNWKGQLRKILYHFFAFPFFMIIHLRHGIMRTSSGVERGTLLPDLFIRLKRSS